MKHIQTLRRLKESIRKFVLYETIPSERRKHDQEYVNHLIEHDNVAITLRGVSKTPLCSGNEDDLKELSSVDHDEIVYKAYNRKAYNLKDEQNGTIYLGVHINRLIEKETHEKDKDDEDPFKTIPCEIKTADMLVYGVSLAQFVIFQLTRTKLDALWLVLRYILNEVRSLDAVRILMYKDNWRNLLRMNDTSDLDSLLLSILQSSSHSAATALYFRYLTVFLAITNLVQI